METTQDKINNLFKETDPEEATKVLIAFVDNEIAKTKQLYKKYGKEVVDRIMLLQGKYADAVEPYIQKHGLPRIKSEMHRKISPLPKPIINYDEFIRGERLGDCDVLKTINNQTAKMLKDQEDFIRGLFEADSKWYLSSRIVSQIIYAEESQSSCICIFLEPYTPTKEEVKKIEEAIEKLKERGIL